MAGLFVSRLFLFGTVRGAFIRGDASSSTYWAYSRKIGLLACPWQDAAQPA
jgi:hypothetical protein